MVNKIQARIEGLKRQSAIFTSRQTDIEAQLIRNTETITKLEEVAKILASLESEEISRKEKVETEKVVKVIKKIVKPEIKVVSKPKRGRKPKKETRDRHEPKTLSSYKDKDVKFARGYLSMAERRGRFNETQQAVWDDTKGIILEDLTDDQRGNLVGLYYELYAGYGKKKRGRPRKEKDVE